MINTTVMRVFRCSALFGLLMFAAALGCGASTAGGGGEGGGSPPATGAGKTTFAREFLPQEADCPTFVNADLIADGLSPFDPARVAIRSGRIMLQFIREHAERGETFAFETTPAGRNHARSIRRWGASGYRVTLVFLSLPSPEMAVSRVAERVLQGGHGVAEDVVRRRFIAGRENFETLYKPLVDEWLHYDNSGAEPVLLEGGIGS